MDFSTKHWYLLKRQFPSVLKVHSADFLPRKTQPICAIFKYPSISFILEGRGELKLHQQLWPIVAPCVITEWPGELFEYGPTPSTHWTEFYIKYDPECLSQLEAYGFIDRQKPVRPIKQLNAVKDQIQMLWSLANSRDPVVHADLFDRICDQVILTALTSPFDVDFTERDVFKKIEVILREKFDQSFSLEDLARQFDMSPQTFRRRCYEAHQMSPIRYMTRIKIEESLRLLSETRMSIKEIALKAGFKDAQYFSRRFRQEIGKSPSCYRKGDGAPEDDVEDDGF